MPYFYLPLVWPFRIDINWHSLPKLVDRITCTKIVAEDVASFIGQSAGRGIGPVELIPKKYDFNSLYKKMFLNKNKHNNVRTLNPPFLAR